MSFQGEEVEISKRVGEGGGQKGLLWTATNVCGTGDQAYVSQLRRGQENIKPKKVGPAMMGGVTYGYNCSRYSCTGFSVRGHISQ